MPVAVRRPSHPAMTGLPLSLRGVAKRFGALSVLRDLNLHIPAGQFVAIVGRSGSGKSTLLRLLGGLDQPDAGRIDAGSESHAASAVRTMFQEPRLLPWARVVDNVTVGLGARAGRDSRGRALEALAQVGLADRAADWPSVLSGGQKQRIALARALVSRPRALLLDEPLGALDALTRIEMQRLIEGVWLDHGFTAVLVTHDVSEALVLADRILVLEEGAIALDLTVPWPRPRSRGDAELAALEDRILRHLLKREDV